MRAVRSPMTTLCGPAAAAGRAACSGSRDEGCEAPFTTLRGRRRRAAAGLRRSTALSSAVQCTAQCSAVPAGPAGRAAQGGHRAPHGPYLVTLLIS